jgi:DNA repair exonuclease SbcCD ATPase subunit
MSGKGLRIVALQAENFKRLRAIHIEPNGSPVVSIVGQNGAGKSSCLDAIWAALGGEKASPAVPIRRGAETAEVTVDLGEFIVVRRWTAKGSTLVVKSRDGMKYPSAQTMLDKLVGKLSFDPLAFTRAKPAEQVETLRGLVGLDFRILDTQRKTLYDQRTEVNREVTRVKATLETMQIAEAPDEPVSVADLLKEQDKVIARQREYEQLQRLAEGAVSRRATAEAAVARAKEALAKALREVEQAEAQLKAARDGEEEAAGELAVAEKPDLAAIREKLAKVEEINAAVRAKKQRAAAAQLLHAKEKDAAALTEKIEAIDRSKAESLSQAQFPVTGLSFDEQR